MSTELAPRSAAHTWAKAYGGRKYEAVLNCGQTIWLQRDNDGNYRLQRDGCNLRWCPNCHSRAFHKQRKRIRRMITATPQRDLRFVTLTLKHGNSDLRKQLEYLTASFRRLRQTRLWKKKVRYGSAVIEITYNAQRREWHPHLHAITAGAYIPQRALSAAWKRATSGSFVVHIKKVTSDSGALGYISKYLSKNPDVQKWPEPDDRAAEIVRATHGKRLIINFGKWPDLPDDDQPTTTWQPVAPWSYICCAARDGEEWAIALLNDVQTSLGRPTFILALQEGLAEARGSPQTGGGI